MRLGVQLFTLRDLLDQDLPGTLSRVRQAGYRFVETAGLHGRSPEDFRSLLDRHDLVAVASHVGLGDLERDFEATIATADTIGAKWLVVPWIDKKEFEPGWEDFALRLGGLAERTLARGLPLAYHNHDFEFAEEDGVPGFERFWDAAPETVEAELDVFWVSHAGHVPAQWLRNLAGRVPLAHFKDGKGLDFCPVGEGDLDWKPIIESAKLAGVEYAIVELDHCPRDPIDCVTSSLRYLRDLGIEP